MREDSSRPAQTLASLRVWDLPTRLFHWLLAALIGLQWLTANADILKTTFHPWGDYAILTLVVWRLCWGFVGSATSRFANFLSGPRAVTSYARTLLRDEHPVIVGHNPLGGWSVLLMLVLAALQAAAGLFANVGPHTAGILTHTFGNDTIGILAAAHQIGFNLLLVLIVLHIGAVFLHLFVGENDLVTPMLTGRKHLLAALAAPDRPFAGNLRAAFLLLCIAGLLWTLLRL